MALDARTGITSPDKRKTTTLAGRLAVVGMGVEPGLSDVFARYAADELFSEIDEAGSRMREIRRMTRGRLRLGAIPTIAPCSYCATETA